MNITPTYEPDRILLVGRSPSVLVETVDLLRAKGYTADATNQFDQVLDDYDVADLDGLVSGEVVPTDTRDYLREHVSQRNPQVSFVQGLAGIADVIAAQVEAVTSDEGPGSDGALITYDVDHRCVPLTLTEPAHVHLDARWHTSFVPPEPHLDAVFDGNLKAGDQVIPLPDRGALRSLLHHRRRR